MRMMSKSATGMVYHRPECRYAGRIRKTNRIQMKWEDAEWRGYRPCKCCGNGAFLFKLNQKRLENFAAQHDMNVDLKNGKIYVRTAVGCWKLVYKICDQKFILLHRNYADGRVPLEEADRAPYHRQSDVSGAEDLMKFMKYIYEHDIFKQATNGDYRRMPQDTAKQKAYYRAARKRAARRSMRNVDRLFAILEQEEGFRKLSFC